MKVFISADIEGTNGICHWDETILQKAPHQYYAEKMTAEVAAVCNGINRADKKCYILVKDAHDSARNLDHSKLPQNVTLNRGWAKAPLSMMDGLDATFDASVFTGYHSSALTNGNPLAHTMDDQIMWLKINGILASECLMNYYASLYCGVPLVMVSGDEALCQSMKEIEPNLYTVATVAGRGGSSTSEHPVVVNERLEQTAHKAVEDRGRMDMSLPKSFKTEICFKTHIQASRAAYYPGAFRISDHVTGFDTEDYMDFLTFFMFTA